MDNEVNRYDNLVRYAELIWNGHLHTEKLSHEIFYVLTALIIGSWTISSQLKLESQIPTKILLNLFAMILTIAGFLIIYRLQQSVQGIHLKMNLIRKKLGLDDVKVDGKPIFEDWQKYKLETIKDLDLIPRNGFRSAKPSKDKKNDVWLERFSWWAIYKWLYVVMFAISMIFCLSSIPS